MKKVYVARDTLLDRDVALALIKGGGLEDENRSRFVREAKVMGHLGQHPNIVSVYDLGEENGQLYMVTELVSGESVEDMIGKAPEGRLAVDRSVDIAIAVCRALAVVHANGIVHRDLKPGNVYVNVDGTAKIGDFGLAFGLDLSRMTRSAMTMGTVSYMTPEQAMGLQPTPKADLYSLGAMLYEMLTGRPPFTGDTVVSVIGQHMNIPPVSPKWHRREIPVALESLVMQLLEKNPENRPLSAAAVLLALESIRDVAGKRESQKATPPGEDPLYRRVFVGRQAEMKRLQSAFDGVVSGQGSLMMVSGEPGIGKTALCEELSTYVALRGGRTLWGHCYADGSLSLPYLAFVEAIRAYAISRGVNELRQELGSGAADLARIVPEIRERLKIRLRPKRDAEEERYRLMQAGNTFLANAAAKQPILLVLEDLHDADQGTLDMLTHASRNLVGMRLLIVGTYRDVEAARSRSFSAALPELGRVAGYGRIRLHCLDSNEVRRMLERFARESVPQGLAEAVHRQTEGNPLFAQEVVRFLAEKGLITRKGGHWRPAKDTTFELSIPEGLKDVIRRRLSLVSNDCSHLLSVASVIGQEFAMETLRAVAGISDEAFVAALKEAVRLSVLEEMSQVGLVRYRFAHAFFRQSLYEEMIAPQRMQIHLRVGRFLEALYAQRIDEHAAALAEHFSHCADPTDLKKAVSYGEMAARRATDVYAYGEAARLLDQTLKVQRVLDPDDQPKVCDLLLALCDALLQVPDTDRVLDTEALAAFSLSQSMGDNVRAVRACWTALFALVGQQAGRGATSPRWIEWTERADRCARPESSERAWVDLALGCTKCQTADRKSGLELLRRALDLARRVGDQEAAAIAGCNLLQYRTAPHHLEETMRLADELWVSRSSFRRFFASSGLSLLGDAFLSVGDRRRAEEAFGELRILATRTSDLQLGLGSAAMEGVLAVMDGRLEEALLIGESIRDRGREAGITGSANMYASLACGRAGVHLGRYSQLSDATLDCASCLQSAYTGDNTEASRILDEQVVKRPELGTDDDETRASVDTMYLEASVLAAHHRAAELLLGRLSRKGLVTSGIFFPTCVPRHLAGAALLLGKNDLARDYYLEAIGFGMEMGFRPEVALARFQLFELLTKHYPNERQEAMNHLDFATREFAEMKMLPWAERARNVRRS